MRIVARLAVAAVFAACTNPPATTIDDGPGPGPGEPDAKPPDVVPPVQCESVIGEPDLTLELVAGGFTKPVHVEAAPHDERLFVLEQHSGLARIVHNGMIRERPFIDVSDQIARAFEQGLLSLEFHPAFAINGRLFVTYARSDNDVVLEEWAVSTSDDNSAQRVREILAVEQPTPVHQGGRIEFGPDGYLYVGLGDSGPTLDMDGKAQDLSLLVGKILRIDVDAKDPGLEYAVPADNPFVGTPGARGEIWALGVRNPWSWSFDPATGHLFMGDVGFNQFEEINVIPSSASPGQNFGWPVVTGVDLCVDGVCDPTAFVAPVHVYSYASQQFCAVTGGQVYRGCRMPGHHGKYFFSDFCAAFLRSFHYSELDPEIGAVTEWESITGMLGKVSALSVDAEGELLVLDWEEGTLYRVVPL